MQESGRKQGAPSPCGACRLLRRKCTLECVFAPYFPADELQKFANVHKVFGANNVNKMLQELPIHQRGDAVRSMVYEANAWVRDPVYGCAGVISSLQQQINVLQTQLAQAQAEVVHLKLQLPGRIDNEVKNYSSPRIKRRRRRRRGLPPYPPEIDPRQPSLSPPPPQQLMSSPSPTTSHHHHHQSFSAPTTPTHTSSSFQTPPSTPSSFTTFSQLEFSLPPRHAPHNTTNHTNNNIIGNTNFLLPSSPMSTRTHLSPQLSASTPSSSQLELNYVGYGRNSSLIVPSNSDGSDGNGVFSQIPSSQFSSSSMSSNPGINFYNSNVNNVTSNGDGVGGYGSGYLEDIVQGAHALRRGHVEGLNVVQTDLENNNGGDGNGGGGGGGENHSFEGFGRQWNDSSGSFSLFSGLNQNEEPANQINSIQEQVPPWFSYGGENSNGQSSLLTADDMGLEMQQIAPLFPFTTTTDHAGNSGFGSVDN